MTNPSDTKKPDGGAASDETSVVRRWRWWLQRTLIVSDSRVVPKCYVHDKLPENAALDEYNHGDDFFEVMEVAEHNRTIERLTRSNERMKAALETIKDKDSYFAENATMDWDGAMAIAREALAEIERGEK